MMGEVLECQLLATPVCVCVTSKNCNAAVDTFARGIFQPALHIELECIPAGEVIMMKEAFGSTAFALHPGPCLGWRGNAVAVSHLRRHSPWTGPGACSYSVLLPQQIQQGS